MMCSLAESVDVFVEERVGMLASAIGLYSKCYQRYLYIAVSHTSCLVLLTGMCLKGKHMTLAVFLI